MGKYLFQINDEDIRAMSSVIVMVPLIYLLVQSQQ